MGSIKVKTIFGQLSLVSGCTIISRVLGLIRDIAFFAAFGTSVFGEAFLLAFTIPNLFRRMLGEGTLTSAFIPVFSDLDKGSGRNAAWSLLNQVLSRQIVFLGILTVGICSLSWICCQTRIFAEEKWHFVTMLNTVTFPYVCFICVAAVLVGALNVMGSFSEGAISPIVLNLSMILTLSSIFVIEGLDLLNLAFALAFCILLAGFLQAALPWSSLSRHFKWRWRPDSSNSRALSQVSSLFWVGALGAAVAQVNLLVSRILAYSLDEGGGVSYLYIAARLVELPLGVFVIALSTVLFPKLAREVGESDQRAYAGSFYFGCRLILAISLPAALGLFFLSDLLIGVFFEWKNFAAESVGMASKVLEISAWTLPFYAVSTFLVKAHHSQKRMKVPFQAALVSLVTNLCASLLLMENFGVVGLAWANFVASAGQTIFLAWKFELLTLGSILHLKKIAFPLSLFGCAMMFLFLYCGNLLDFGIDGKVGSFVRLLFLSSIGAITYLVALALARFPWSDRKPLPFSENPSI